MMSWVDAVKLYAEKTGTKFRIHKKGTAEYEAIKKLQSKGTGGISSKKAAKMAKEMMEPAAKKTRGRPKKASAAAHMTSSAGATASAAPAKMRKPRSDIGQKRAPSTLAIAKESVKQGIVSRAVALGRKPRSDKGKKRGARGAKANMTSSKGGETSESFDL